MKISVRVSSHMSTIILKFSLLVIFLGSSFGAGVYFYNKHQENERKELADRLEQARLSQEQADRAEKEKLEAQRLYQLEQQKLKLESDRLRQVEAEKQRLVAEEKEKIRLANLEKERLEKEENKKRLAAEERKNYLNNVSSSAFDILSSLKEVFPTDGKTNRNTYDAMTPFLNEYTKFVSSLNGDTEAFALESVVELINFVQIRQNIINESKKKNDSWDAYIAGLNSPERKRQEEESKRIGKELADRAASDLERKLRERKAARARQLSIWRAAGGGREVILGDGK